MAAAFPMVIELSIMSITGHFYIIIGQFGFLVTMARIKYVYYTYNLELYAFTTTNSTLGFLRKIAPPL
jgi:hypothetical protein